MAQTPVFGRDVRFSSLPLTTALMVDLNDAEADVGDLGPCGTEQIYVATASIELDGGIMVSASLNPPEYNGMKFVRGPSRSISGDCGLGGLRACPTPCGGPGLGR